MAKKDDKVESLDTVPPPPSGDAYSAETVQRVVPPELLAEAKKELLKRPRPAPRKQQPPAVSATPLTPAPLPMIERIFEDDDAAGDEAKTLLQPRTQGAERPGSVASNAGVAQTAQASHPEVAPATSGGERRPSRARSRGVGDGWLGSLLIFVGALVLVLLTGLLLMRYLAPS